MSDPNDNAPKILSSEVIENMETTRSAGGVVRIADRDGDGDLLPPGIIPSRETDARFPKMNPGGTVGQELSAEILFGDSEELSIQRGVLNRWRPFFMLAVRDPKTGRLKLTDEGRKVRAMAAKKREAGVDES